MSVDPLHIGQEQRPRVSLTAIQAELLRRTFREYAKATWPLFDPAPLKWNWHLDAICDHLVWVYMREIRVLSINIQPRSTKSSLIAVAFPTWVWTNQPSERMVTASYSADLAERDSVKSRQIIMTQWYRERFGHQYALRWAQNQQHRYYNDEGGLRFATSPEGTTTGEGGNLLIIDDPHNVMDVESEAKRLRTIAWHDTAWLSRRNDWTRAGRIYAGQRTHPQDLFGHLKDKDDGELVELIIPAEYDPKRHCITFANTGKGADHSRKLWEDPRTKEGEVMDPQRTPAELLESMRTKMGKAYNAQYQQDPESDDEAILKRRDWRQWTWPKGHPHHGKPRELPAFFEIIQVYDTAFEEKEESDYSARTTWGLFMHYPERWNEAEGRVVQATESVVCCLLLERWKDRVSMPKLRKEAKDAALVYSPDRILVEKKASGHSLVQELRAANLPVTAIKVGTKDKVARAHFAAVPLEGGRVYYVPRKWATEVIGDCAKFPRKGHNDIPDTVVMALSYARRKQMRDLPDDETGEGISLWAPPVNPYA